MKTTENLSKDEFLILLMLYAANADAYFLPEEESFIKERAGEESWNKVHQLFSKLSDKETLDIIMAHKGVYCRNEEEKVAALKAVKEVFTSDHRYSQMEHVLMDLLGLLLK